MEQKCWEEIYLDDQLVKQFKKQGEVPVSAVQGVTLTRNIGVIINNSLLGVYDSADQVIRKLNTNGVSGMTPGDHKDLQLLYDMLWNDNIKVIVLDSVAGSGKTSTVMAFANHFILNKRVNMFDHLVLTRPNSEVGAGHGFLPGTIDEKLAPLLGAYYQWIERFSNLSIEELKTNGTIVAQPIAYIRGLDIKDSMLIVDEAQNTSRHEIKTILTRVGENTKVIIMGDSSANQIDVKGLSPENNGLKHVADNFYGKFDWFGYVKLKECLRGDICKAATQLL